MSATQYNAMERIIWRAVNDFRIGPPKDAHFIGQPMKDIKDRDAANAHYWVQMQQTEVMGIKGIVVADAWDYLGRNFERLDRYEVEQMLIEKRALFLTSYRIDWMEASDTRKDIFRNHIPYAVVSGYQSIQKAIQMLEQMFGLVAVTAVDQHCASWREAVVPNCRIEEWIETLYQNYSDKELRLFIHQVSFGAVKPVAKRHAAFDWNSVLSPNGRLFRRGEKQEILNHLRHAVDNMHCVLADGFKWGKPSRMEHAQSEEDILFEKMIAEHLDNAFDENLESIL